MISTTAMKRNRSLWLLGLSVLLGGILLAVSIRGISWHEMIGGIRQAQPGYLMLAVFTISLSFFMRGLRWRVLIIAKRPLAPLTSFWATMIGYLGNSFLPARAGDVIRPIITGRAIGTGTSYALAALFTERIVDMVALVLMSLIVSLSLTVLPSWLNGATQVMTVLGVLGTIGILVAPRMERSLRRLLTCLPLPLTFSNRLTDLLQEFLLGMRALRHPGSGLQFAVLTALVWLLDTLTAIETARALHLSLPWQWAMLLLVALGLATVVPSTPGYVGIYQFVAISVLVPFGLSHAHALAFILIFQAVNYVAVILWGGIGIWRMTTMHYLHIHPPLERKIVPAAGIEGR